MSAYFIGMVGVVSMAQLRYIMERFGATLLLMMVPFWVSHHLGSEHHHGIELSHHTQSKTAAHHHHGRHHHPHEASHEAHPHSHEANHSHDTPDKQAPHHSQEHELSPGLFKKADMAAAPLLVTLVRPLVFALAPVIHAGWPITAQGPPALPELDPHSQPRAPPRFCLSDPT